MAERFTLGDAMPPPLFRGDVERAADYHARAVADLESRGWATRGFRRAVVLALVNETRDAAGLERIEHSCREGRCRCQGSCAFPDARDAFPFALIPDAYRLVEEHRRVQVAEVNVTHYAGIGKWAAVLDSLDFDGWRFDLLTIDAHGGRVLYEHGTPHHLPGARP